MTESTAAALRDLLAVRYAAPEWHLEHEVTYGTRRLDTVAFRLWGGSGKGHLLLGFELKVSRSDWRRELQQFEKGRDWADIVDEFYVVAPKEVVPLDELPRGWGLLEVRGSRLYLRAHPSRPAATPEVMPRAVTARFLDRLRLAASRTRHEIEADLRPVLLAHLETERTEREARTNRQLEEKAAQWDALLEALRSFGVGPLPHDPAKLVMQAVALVRAFERLPTDWQVERIGQEAQRIADLLSTAAPAWRDAVRGWQALVADARNEQRRTA